MGDEGDHHLIPSQWDITVQKDLVELFSTNFDEIWTKLTSRVEESLRSNSNSSDTLYSESCNFFQKLLSAVEIIPEVHTSLSCSVVSQIQKSASSVLKSFIKETKNRNANESQCLEINRLLKILQISNELLDSFTQKNLPGLGININMELVDSTASTLFENLIEFLTHPTGKDMKKAIYVRFLLTARKIWSYLKSRALECQIVQGLATTIEMKKNDLFTKNPNAPLFVRFSTEILSKTETVDWRSVLFQNKEKDEFLSVLIPLIEVDPSIVDAEIIQEVRKRLISNDLDRRKEAAFIIKSISAILAGSNGELSVKCSTEMLLHLGKAKFINFWSNYFELYEILDEKQSHIVEPVLLNKMGIFDNPDTMTCKWFFVILSKMIHHDNRHIAEAGLLKFLNNRIRDELIGERDLRRDMFEEFLHSTILPFLKDHAGWVLPEAEFFFETVEKFGNFLQQLFGNELLMVERIIGFIIHEKKCLSPCSLYFLIQSLYKGIVLEEENQSEKLPLLDDGPLQNCMSLISQCSSQGLTTVDKFLRLRVENDFVDIISRWGSDLQRLCQENHRCVLVPDILLKLLTFFGSLSQVTVIDNPVTRNKLAALAGKVDNKYKTNCEVVRLVMEGTSGFSPLQIRGLFRLRWLITLKSPLMCEKIVVDIINGISKMELEQISGKEDEDTGISTGMTDFFRGLSQNLEISKEPIEFEVIFDIIKDECILRIEQVFKHLSKSENQSPTAVLISSQRLEFVEIIFSYFGKHFRLPENIISLEDVLVVLDSKTLSDQSIVCNHFVMWKLLSLLLDQYDVSIVENLVGMFSSGGFEHLKLTDHEIPKIRNNVNFGVNLTSEFYKVKFDSLASILEKHIGKEIGSLDMWQKCISSGLDHVEKAGPHGVISAMRFFKTVLPFLEASKYDDPIDIRNMLYGFNDLAWNLVFEMRKTESFWIGIREFVDLITQPFFAGQGVLTKFSEKIFKHGETVTGLVLILVQRLCDQLKNRMTSYKINELEEITEVCVTAVLFGPALMKSNRVTFGIWEYLNSKDQVNVLQDDSTFGSNARTRIKAVWILQSLVKLLDMQALKKILIVLLDRNDKESVTRKRYFGNSITHRIKQRIAQTILILQPYFDLELSKLVLQRLMDSLTLDSPQPSVRYLSEWVIIKMLLKYPDLWESFFGASINCCNKRVGFGAFFSTICLHTTTLMGSSTEEEFFFKESLNALAELILGHHVTVRIYAQACFREIYKRAEGKGWTVLKDKYSVFHDALDAASKNSGGNFSKLFDAVSKDFYLQTFNANAHYIPEVIFVYLPRLSEVADDELPLESYFEIETTFCNPFSGDSKELKLIYEKYRNLAWHLKATAGDGREMGEEVPNYGAVEQQISNDDSASLANFQKKINPWKSLSIVDQIDDFSLEFLTKKRSAMEGGLIVVASLIDKIPNLGGLCRSCEIFGVSKYVVPSLKILQDQNFISLSVSAHNWVDVLEVPPRDLEAFLCTYATKGYTILGVEQALESTRLNDFQFPRKSLLLLGNEKYGIPTNLLHLVDKCLEIPQVGVIRSLNVHVTGALCIWEYAAQHLV